MSKAKAGSKALAETSSWDKGLLDEVADDSCWSPYLVFLAPDHPLTGPHLQALVASADGGSRRKFAVIDKDGMLQSAQEDAKLVSAAGGGRGGGGKKSKLGSTAPVDKPLHAEVCERVVSALGEGGVPPALVARMLKYKILRKRMQDIASREALKKEEEASKQQKPGADGKGGKKGSGRTSKVGGAKKGKETPAVEATPSVVVPQKPPTSMRKRGEEDLDSKYIDDEPAGGPSCYFLLTGFTSAELFEHLEAVKLTAHALVKAKGQEEASQPTSGLSEEEWSELQQEAASLQQFWMELHQKVKATPSGSMLRDMAQLDLEVTQVGVPDDSEEKARYAQTLFDTLAHRIYLLLEQQQQYQHYLSYLDVFPLPLGTPRLGSDTQQQQQPGNKQPAEVEPNVDMRRYRALMGHIPDACCSIPLMLHCMVEQVSTTVSGGNGLPDSQGMADGVDPAILTEMNNTIAALALPTKDKKKLLSDDAKSQLSQATVTSCFVVPSGDDSMKRTFHLKNSPEIRISKSETATNTLSVLMSILNPPIVPSREALKQSAKRQSLEHFCLSDDISRTFLNHAMIVLSLEHVHMSNASIAPSLNEHQLDTRLLFDYPFSFPLTRSTEGRKALVPLSEATGQNSMVSPKLIDSTALSSHHELEYELDLPESSFNLESYSSCELLKKEVLLQILQSLQQTYPYTELFHHFQSQCVVVVLHTGFDGNPIHKYKWSSQAHSRVGFHHYLEHVMERFGSLVDKTVAEDAKRKEAYNIDRQKLIQQKLEALQQEGGQPPPTNDDAKSGMKGSKKGSAVSSAKKTPAGRSSPGKKSKMSSKECTPAVSTHEVTASETSLPEFQEQKLFPAYDIGDTVLLTKGSVTTQFAADGSQILTKHCQFAEGLTHVNVSVLNRGHTITASLVWQTSDITKANKVDNAKLSNNEEKGDTESEDGEKAPPPVVAGIPQPPQSVAFASLYASFNNGLSLALSHYGPNGNGELPYNPPRPRILDQPTRPDSTLGSRPQSQLGASSQKLGKKQQEQQQQFLEQQRLLEEQQDRERKVARAKFHEQQNMIRRHNKYQQLFVSLPYGLHVHCQVSVDLEADPSLNDGSDGQIVVSQSYVTKTKGVQRAEDHLLKAAFVEKQRCCLSDGLVVRTLLDDTVIIECADGSVYRTATQEETEHFMETVAGVKDRSATPELERVPSEAPARIASTTKVSFANGTGKSIPKEPEKLERKVWVVTTSSGQRYLWKSEQDSSTREPPSELNAEQSKGLIEKEESDSQEQLGSGDRQYEVVTLPKVESFPATDPITKEVLVTREDNVRMLYRPDGTCVTDHSDGTRFTVRSTPLPKTASSSSTASTPEVTIECPGFARIVYQSESQKCKLQFPDKSEITCSKDGGYVVSKEHDCTLEISSSGKAVFTPAKSEGMQEGKPTSMFTIDHTGSGEILNGSDPLRNTFIVDHEGEGSVDLGGGCEIPAHPAFDPRYFIVHADGTCFELLKGDEVNSVIIQAKSNPNTVVLHEDIPSEPHCTSTTILEPHDCGDKGSCLVPYEEDNIIPVNLRGEPCDSTNLSRGMQNGLHAVQVREGKKRFGVGVGRGLMVGTYRKPPPPKACTQPEAICFRQFLHMQPVSSNLRIQLLSGLTAYANWCQKQDQDGESAQPVDTRGDDEKLVAKELQSKWIRQLRNEATMLQSELPAKYIQEVTRQPDQVTLKPATLAHKSVKIHAAVKKELEEANATQQALRNQLVPPYFQFEDGKQYLQSQSPDMKVLASKLAQPEQDSKQTVSGRSTPSTLHSTSMTIPQDGLESPTQSEGDEVGPVTSLSKLRPSHPTPDHAQGNATPTELRPTNPTPSHALKATIVGAGEPSTSSSSITTRNSFTTKRADMPQSTKNASTYITVTGQPRKSPVIAPSSIQGGFPGKKPNIKFAMVEDPVRRKIHTSSTSGVEAARGFLLQPEQVDFGVLREGCTYAFTVVLRNTGIDSCRFKIKQPPPSTGIKVVFTPGPVAAGMSRSLDVEIFAMAVGVIGECGMGSVQHEVEIMSETTIMQLSVKASILTSAAYKHRLPTHPQGKEAEGVRMVTDRPTSRENLTRPQRSIS